MSPAAKDIDSFLAALPEDQRAALQKVRETVRATAPEAVESISYGIPTYKYKGRPLIYFGAGKKHCAIYGGVVADATEAELEGYSTAKGTIRFPPDKPLPAEFVERLVKAQIGRIEAGAGGYEKKANRKDD
jgi:uncharacterized protein YdhG (YjbR/CyaY superfamily)